MSSIVKNDKMSYFRVNNGPPIRKLFVSQMNDESSAEFSTEHETFRVFLRVKPIRDCRLQENTIKIVNYSTLICKPPVTSKYKKAERIEYTFSHIFGPETTQQEIFTESVVPCIEDLLNCRNSLLFAYGTTNAGKTYTVQGSILDPGIIPRTLYTVFSNVRPDRKVVYAPYMARNILKLDKERSVGEMCFKNEILRCHHDNASKYSKGVNCTNVLESNSEFNQFLQILEENYVELKTNMPVCSVWISFVELYNETIFDLLEIQGHMKKPLKLSADKHDNFYVKGLKHVCVQSAEEAYMIYKYGKKNLNVACTKMNERSSRSHCIFTIKLINHEHRILSNLSICDLAGTERQAKAQNIGIRLKESGIINGSLFQLNRCLRAIRENQSRNVSQLIPYRHSNLTKLFHSAFDEKTNEKIVMIVNINPSPELYDETQQVLKMCAIASKIKNKPIITKMLRQSTRFTTYVYGNECYSSNDDDQQFENEFSDYEEDSVEEPIEYQKEISRLKELLSLKDNEIDNLKDRLKESSQIYIQMQNDFNRHLDSTDERIKEQQESYEKRFAMQKEYYEWKLLELRKNATLHNVVEPDFEKEILEKNLLIEELKLQLSKKNDDRNSLTLSADLQIELNQKNEKITELKSLLEEAKAEYIALADELKSSLNKLANLENKLQEKNDDYEDLEQNFQLKQNLIEELEERTEKLEETLYENTIEHEQILANVEKQCNEIKNEKEKLQEELNKMKEKRTTLYENAIEHERILANLEELYIETKNEKEKLQEELNKMKEERTTLYENAIEHERILVNVEKQYIEAKNEKEKLHEELNKIREERNTLRANTNEHERILANIENQWIETKNEKERLQAELNKIKGERNDTKRHNTRSNRTPLKQLDKENKYFINETPAESAKKNKKTENNIGKKKKLFSTPVNNSEDLVSFESSEKEKNEDSEFIQIKSKSDMATPAQTVKAVLRKKRIN